MSLADAYSSLVGELILLSASVVVGICIGNLDWDRSAYVRNAIGADGRGVISWNCDGLLVSERASECPPKVTICSPVKHS